MPVTSAIASATAPPATSDSSGRRGGSTAGPQEDRDEDARARRRVPAAAEPAAAFGLLLGDRDRALRVVLPEQPLGRRAHVLVAIDVPEAAREEGLHGVGGD